MSLAGRGVLVTRPAAMAATLAERIRSAGGRPFLFPAIEIQALERPAALSRLGDFALAIFVSPTAVEQALAMAAPPWPASLRVAAVGEGTRRALEAAGFRDIVAPREGADSEALLAAGELSRISGRVLIVRGAGGRELLARTLAERGCEVTLAECYRRAPPSADAGPLVAAWAAGEVHAVTVFSGESLDNLVRLFGEARLATTPLFASHARIAERARRLGLQALVAGPGDDAMVERLVAYFHE